MTDTQLIRRGAPVKSTILVTTDETMTGDGSIKSPLVAVGGAGGSPYKVESEAGPQDNDTPDFVTFVTLQFDVTETGRWRIGWKLVCSPGSNVCEVQLNGSFGVIDGPARAVNAGQVLSGFAVVDVVEIGTLTFELEFRPTDEVTSTVSDGRIEAFPVGA